MPTLQLPLIPGTLPVGACYTNEQQRLNAYMAVSYAQLNGQTMFNYGPDVPAIENQSYPWLRTTDGLWYVYLGVWRSPRPLIEQNSSYRIMWVGDEADIPTINGGTAGVATETTGPFWEKDTLFAGRSPMMPGEIPSSNPTKTLNVREVYGEGAHLQTVLELPAHSHPPLAEDATGFLGYPGVPSGNLIVNSTSGNDTASSARTGDTGGSEAMPIIHPVYGCWILKPTIRRFYTIP